MSLKNITINESFVHINDVLLPLPLVMFSCFHHDRNVNQFTFEWALRDAFSRSLQAFAVYPLWDVDLYGARNLEDLQAIALSEAHLADLYREQTGAQFNSMAGKDANAMVAAANELIAAMENGEERCSRIGEVTDLRDYTAGVLREMADEDLAEALLQNGGVINAYSQFAQNIEYLQTMIDACDGNSGCLRRMGKTRDLVLKARWKLRRSVRQVYLQRVWREKSVYNGGRLEVFRYNWQFFTCQQFGWGANDEENNM